MDMLHKLFLIKPKVVLRPDKGLNLGTDILPWTWATGYGCFYHGCEHL